MVTNATRNKEEKKIEEVKEPEEEKKVEEVKEPEPQQYTEQIPSLAPVFERRQRNKRYKNYNNIYGKKEDQKGK